VPVSSSLASTGAPANAPISAGITCNSPKVTPTPGAYVFKKSVATRWQISEFAGAQAVTAA
jgi:hypothetical protein